MTIAIHPQKYPNHSPSLKGAVYDGICNRTACDNKNAQMYNLGTFGYYCRQCAKGINWKWELCVEVNHQLTMEEMEQRKMEEMDTRR